MEKTHGAFTDLALGTPRWFTLSARLLCLGLLGQFRVAGAALYRDAALWERHAALCGALSVPAAALLDGALALHRLRGFGWWAGLTVLLYLVQVALAAEAAASPLSFQPFNGALLLTASLVLLAKVVRRRARPVPKETTR